MLFSSFPAFLFPAWVTLVMVVAPAIQIRLVYILALNFLHLVRDLQPHFLLVSNSCHSPVLKSLVCSSSVVLNHILLVNCSTPIHRCRAPCKGKNVTLPFAILTVYDMPMRRHQHSKALRVDEVLTRRRRGADPRPSFGLVSGELDLIKKLFRDESRLPYLTTSHSST